MRRRSKAGDEPVKARRRKTVTRKRRNAPKAAHEPRNAPKTARRRSSSSAVRETKAARLARERDEALEQLSATSEVLKVISSSPGDLEPVFQAMLENAVHICAARFGTLYRFDGNAFHLAAHVGTPTEYAEFLRRRGPFQPVPGGLLDRVTRTKQVGHTADETTEAVPGAVARLGGARSRVCVPMLKDDVLVGAIVIDRQEVKPFSDKQIALLQNFAAQAVIAIENTRLLSELRQRTTDLSESLEQQTATTEVLQVISSSPGALAPVAAAMLANATRICEANLGVFHLYEAGAFPVVALQGATLAFAETHRREPLFRPKPEQPLGRLAATKAVVHIADTLAEPPSMRGRLNQLTGARTILNVPMLKENELVGAIAVYRTEVRPFTDKQIELVKSFAAQAVIAIENTRLLNELRQRTSDLGEALEQQTATSEVLRVISSSPGELGPVFNAMLENATRICEAKFGVMQLLEGDGFRAVALHDVPPAYAQAMRRDSVFRPSAGHPLDRLASTKEVAHIPDVRAEQRMRGWMIELAGARTLLLVPMLKDNELIGVISIYRQEVRPFTDKQISLVENFAAQAVIAIENTRLLNELRESLQQQTATSEVLRVISSSPGELEPVFQAMLENATRICEAKFGMLLLCEGDAFRGVATHGVPAAYAEWHQRQAAIELRDHPDIPISRLARTKETLHISDLMTDRAYIERDSRLVALVESAGARSVLAVPMLKGRELIGAIVIYRQEVRPFADKQIELVKGFASQAAIAIENTRLLSELRESLQQQTATADVLKVISRSTFDLQTVLDTLVTSAARLCEADMAQILRPKDDGFYSAASYGHSAEFDKLVRGRLVFLRGRGSVTGRVLMEGKPIQIPDVLTDPEYELTEVQKVGGFRTHLGVPLLREGLPIGVILLSRKSVRPFDDKHIELATTFADQAGIAIENVRLFDEIQDKSKQLAEASQHKSQFLANMSHELRTPLNAILGYNELILDNIYGATPEKMRAVLQRIESNGKHLLGLINDVLDLSKIEAGQLTLSLADYSLKNVTQTVYTAVEPLATQKKLNLRLDVAADLPNGHGDEHRLTQVLLNLVGNAIKFTDSGEVRIKAGAADGSFRVAVRDTGPGISAADQAKLFQEFQQGDNSVTRKKGGTGLGLAISKRIIEMHGGRIWIESVVGQGSTFSFTLPVVANN